MLPLALRQAIPAYGNEIILMVKGTSLASIITLMEVTGIAQGLISQTYRAMEVFVAAGAIYISINFIIIRALNALETAAHTLSNPFVTGVRRTILQGENNMRNFEKPTRSVAVSPSCDGGDIAPIRDIDGFADHGGRRQCDGRRHCRLRRSVRRRAGLNRHWRRLLRALCAERFPIRSSPIMVSGRTPAALTLDWFNERGLAQVPRQSAAAVTVPGAIDAWTRLHADHGRLPLADVLAPAIEFC